MINKNIFLSFPLTYDIYEKYTFFRGQGNSPANVRNRLISEYARELEDEDDFLVVLSGIALAQWDLSEIDEEDKKNALAMLHSRIDETEAIEEKHAFTEIYQQLSKENPKKNNGKASIKRNYSLNWVIGDTFSHQVTHPAAENTGIFGWYLLFRKVGHYTNWKGQTIQLGYLSICPPKELPQTTAELNALGFLRVMSHGEKWDYLVQIDVQSKRTENSLAMKRIGCFPDAASPNDEMQSCPEVTMPLFIGIDSKTGCPRYEDAICRFYRWYGVGKVD